MLMKKHVGSWRFCADYKALSSKTMKDKFPIPVAKELLDELCGVVFFTKLDLRSVYHQVQMHNADMEKRCSHPSGALRVPGHAFRLDEHVGHLLGADERHPSTIPSTVRASLF
jgi:hypothetical protein